jgi:hypothetical protein
MNIRIATFRKTKGAARVVWNTGKVYRTLVGKCFEITIWKTEEIREYYNEYMCHVTDRWSFKR